jgi:glycine cleavage system H protein
VVGPPQVIGPASPQAFVPYQRGRFATQLPADCLYTTAHVWVARHAEGVWRVGLTQFATRMLGETVDHGFEIEPGAGVRAGQKLGWVEGFKAISELLSPCEGTFVGGNPRLKQAIELLHQDPYGQGWLCLIEGKPDPGCVRAQAYTGILDAALQALERGQSQGRSDEGGVCPPGTD